ncbi:MAG: hypothetical protein IT438_07095 [Phycisphaerales bacterium]|nr:hypothetical protein [Phycisphaerales bacterium]
MSRATITGNRLADLTSLGRREAWEDSPEGWPQGPTHSWLRHHDRYEETCEERPCCCKGKNGRA